MRNQGVAYSIILFITAAIWGFSFVAQRAGMEFIGPYLFNGIRFTLGSFSLIPLYIFYRNKNYHQSSAISFNVAVLRKGLLLGLILFIAASLQQIGMQYTSAANGGFITSLYVILVPLFSVFFKKKIPYTVWVGAFIAFIGMYFLSIQGELILSWGDTLVLISAAFWAVHVILIGKYAPKVSIILLSIIQFGITAILSLLVALFIEDIIWEGIKDAAIPIVYGGFISVGIAYTLQIFAQKKVVAEKAAIILSFESAFALFGGWLILNEDISIRSLIGAGLMLAGIIISQIHWKKRNESKYKT